MEVIDLMRTGETHQSNIEKVYNFLNSDKIKTKYFDSVEWDNEEDDDENKKHTSFTISANGQKFLTFSNTKDRTLTNVDGHPTIKSYYSNNITRTVQGSSGQWWGRIYNCSGGLFFSLYDETSGHRGYKVPVFCIVKDTKEKTSIISINQDDLTAFDSMGIGNNSTTIIALNTKSTSTSLGISITPDSENTTAITTFSPIVVNDDDTTIDKAYALITAQSRQQTTFLLNGKNYYSNGAWAVEDADQDTE